MVCAVYAAVTRGIWLDEFWSLRLGNPGVPLFDAVDRLWLGDTNPFGANLLYRLAVGTGVRDIGALRVILSVPATLLFLAGTAIFSRSSPARDPFYLVMAMLVVALPAFVATFGDFRIYHWQLCAVAVCLQAAYRIMVEGSAAPLGRVATILALVAVVAALSLHFVAGFLVAAAIAPMLLHLVRLRRWRTATAIALAAALAGSATFIMAVIQYGRISQTVDASWIETTTLDAMLMMAGALSAPFLANPAAAAVALVVPRAPPGDRRTFVLVIAAGVVLGGALLTGINAVRPVIVDRYLVPWQPAMCAILAAAIARSLRCGWRLYMVAGCCALSIAVTTVRQSREVGWKGTRDFIASTVRRCPATRVYAISPWRLRNTRDSRAANLERPVFVEAYQRLARNAGFAVAFVPDALRVLDVPAACPLLVWIEHSGGRRLGDAASLLGQARLGFVQPVRVSRFATDDGIVLVAVRND